MAYTVINFKTKKALKEHVSAWNNWVKSGNYVDVATASVLGQSVLGGGRPVRCYNPGLGPDLSNYTGSVALEGPHYPKPRTWYASAELVNGIVVKVK